MVELTQYILVIANAIDLPEVLKTSSVTTSSKQIRLKSVNTIGEAFDICQKEIFDIVLIEADWANNQNRELLEQTIQRLQIPTIVFGEDTERETALSFLQMGAQDYLNTTKLTAELLSLTVDKTIARYKFNNRTKQDITKYQDVVQGQRELICRFSLDGSITFVNEAYCRYCGRSEAELIASNFFASIAPEDRNIVRSQLDSLTSKNPNFNIEYRIPLNGRIYWHKSDYRGIFQEGKLVEYQSVARDITEQKKIDTEKHNLIASLHEHEERFRMMADNAPVSIWSTGIDGGCTFVNRTWLNFTGRNLAEELGDGWQTIVHPEDREQFIRVYRTAFANRERFQQEYRCLRRDGEYRWTINIGIPRFTNDGEFSGYIGSCTDISDRKQAEEILAQQAQRERLLSQIVQHIHKSLELEHVLTAAVEEINNFLCVERIVIFKLDEMQNSRLFYETITPGLAASWELTTGSQQELKEILDRFKQFKRGQILAIDDLQQDRLSNEFATQQKDMGVRSLLMVPLILQDRLWGCLCAQQRSKPRHWQLFEIDLMQQLAVQLSIAIQQSELYEQLSNANRALENLATIDALTGISNRRRFDEFLKNEWQRMAREKQFLSVILCDIDYFKQYNDTYGHVAGDRCLQSVAQAINQTIKRPADLAARYGGEEIVLVLPNTPPEGAYKLAQKIANAVRELKIEHRTSNVSPYVTISVGVAGCIPDYSLSPLTSIDLADIALYRAKKEGRDRVCLHSQTVGD
jgi:diguanylate cyclase (GGDEF)-like protein/PAS domain S-box-containing protein